jgi:hypothetical protein
MVDVIAIGSIHFRKQDGLTKALPFGINQQASPTRACQKSRRRTRQTSVPRDVFALSDGPRR